MALKGYVPLAMVRELLASVHVINTEDEAPAAPTISFDLEAQLRASLHPSKPSDLNIPWLSRKCEIASPRAQGYTWREMMEGSKDGYRRAILAWAVTRPDLHDGFTRYAAGVCLAEGYGAFGSFETVTHAKAELLEVDDAMVARAIAGYHASEHLLGAGDFSGVMKDALRAAIYGPKGKPRRRARRA